MLACKKGADVHNQNSIQRLNPSEIQYVSGGFRFSLSAFSPSRFIDPYKKQASIVLRSIGLTAIVTSFLWLTQEIPFIRNISKFIANSGFGCAAGYVYYKLSNKHTEKAD
jgi:hypothetical protein